jgi:subtilisin family serine protease
MRVLFKTVLSVSALSFGACFAPVSAQAFDERSSESDAPIGSETDGSRAHADGPWNLRAIRASKAWKDSRGAGVTVAVLDVGFAGHPLLDGRMLPGINLAGSGRGGPAVSGAADCRHWRTRWLGTKVAGLIAGPSPDRPGTLKTGVAPEAKVLPVRIGEACGDEASPEQVAEGIRWAIGEALPGLKVAPGAVQALQLSYSQIRACAPAEQAAIAAAVTRGIVVVAAAGDGGVDAGDAAPANCEGVIAVGAYARDRKIPWYSNIGGRVVVGAPGGGRGEAAVERLAQRDGIRVAGLRGETADAAPDRQYVVGTAFAAAHVTGAVALMKSLRPQARPDQILTAIVKTMGEGPNRHGYGRESGMLDIPAAMSKLLQIVDGPLVEDAEPNDNRLFAPLLMPGQRVRGLLDTDNIQPRDHGSDIYRAMVAPGREIRFKLRQRHDADVLKAAVLQANGEWRALEVPSRTPLKFTSKFPYRSRSDLTYRNDGPDPVEVELRLRNAEPVGPSDYELFVE